MGMGGHVQPEKVGSFAEVAMEALGGLKLSPHLLVLCGQAHTSAVPVPFCILGQLTTFILPSPW